MIFELFEINNRTDVGELLRFALFLGLTIGIVVGLIYFILHNIKELREDKKNDSNEK